MRRMIPFGPHPDSIQREEANIEGLFTVDGKPAKLIGFIDAEEPAVFAVEVSPDKEMVRTFGLGITPGFTTVQRRSQKVFLAIRLGKLRPTTDLGLLNYNIQPTREAALDAINARGNEPGVVVIEVDAL